MKRILLEFPGHGQGKIFNPDSRNDGSAPFAYLRDVLKKRGYQLDTADDNKVEGCAWVWFWDAVGVHRSPYGLRDAARFVKRMLLGRRQKTKRRQLYQECLRAGLRDRVVLFIGEPPAVRTQNWDQKVHKLFPIIFTWNDSYVDGKKFHKFHWPLAGWFPEVPDIPFDRRKLLTNISGNKFSSHPRELYTARRETIRYFEHHYPDQFDLYGRGWNQPEIDQAFFPSYRGIVKHKWDVYPHYRFGLCYENMHGEPGWVTEKIFDCMRAGCVPIYWGAPNITDYVDAEAFIDRRKFQSNAELADFLLEMSYHEWQRYREAARDYLAGEQFTAFLPPAFTATIIRELDL